MSQAIEQVQACATMQEVRRCVDALDDMLVPLLVLRSGYMTQAARIKQDVNTVRDEERIQAIVDRVRRLAADEGGEPAVVEAIYRSMMEVYISFEHREFARLRGSAVHAVTSVGAPSAAGPSQGVSAPLGGSAVHVVTSVGAIAS
jgi:isochorismate pyruvate lyase